MPAASDASSRTITKLEVQSNNPNRANLYLDGSFAFGLHQELIVRFNLHKGRTLSIAEQQEIEAADAEMKARAVALEYLAHKLRTEQEVRQRLARDDYDSAVIDAVVDRLYELSYLNDERYAQDYARARFDSKGYGPFRIRQELSKRGVSEPFIEQALAQIRPEDVLDAARQHAQKKINLLSADEPAHKRQRKLKGYLRRRGFDFSTIRRVLTELGK